MKNLIILSAEGARRPRLALARSIPEGKTPCAWLILFGTIVDGVVLSPPTSDRTGV
jgi:hypothetical protein